MRISVLPQHPDFSPWAAMRGTQALLDGDPISDAVFASEESGEIVVICRDDHGAPIRTARGGLATRVLRGHVRIIMAPLAQRII